MIITLEHITPNAEELISKYSAVCYNSDTTDPIKNNKRIKHLMKVKHLSTLRHAIATFRVEGISRACSHQFVRSKHLDFLQRSQRYCSEDGFEVVKPEMTVVQELCFQETITHIHSTYDALVASGMKKEDARMVLPNAATTELIVTGNLQSWKDFIALRTVPAAQYEIRQVALGIERVLQAECPNVFGELNNE
jgi:thymidylate synthase (FAD)